MRSALVSGLPVSKNIDRVCLAWLRFLMFPGMRDLVLSGMLLFLVTSAALSQGRLEVTIAGIKEVQGSVRVGLFQDPKNFPGKAVEGKVVPVTRDSTVVAFEGLPPGTYALSVIHDKNDNGKLDTNIIGIPKEGFGFGNDAMGLFGPPSFEKASIAIGTQPVTHVITLRHF